MLNYSVLMSIYEKVQENDLKMSVDSIIHQSYRPEQFVIVYDGPISPSVENLIADYQLKYTNLFFIVKLKENHGLAYALNEGLKICRNDLIMRMDSDDVAFSNRAKIQITEFESNSDLALLGGNTEHFHKTPGDMHHAVSKQPLDLNAIKKTIRKNSAFSHPTVMFKKSVVDSCGGYDPTLKRSQDHDLFSLIVYKGYFCKNLKNTLVYYRSDKQGMLRNRNKDSSNARIIIQKRLLSRRQCSIVDYIYIVLRTRVLQLMPKKMFLWLYSITKEH